MCTWASPASPKSQLHSAAASIYHTHRGSLLVLSHVSRVTSAHERQPAWGRNPIMKDGHSPVMKPWLLCYLYQRRHWISVVSRKQQTLSLSFELAATCFQAFGSVFRGKSGPLPDPTKQQQIVKLRNDGPCGSVLTTVETNQTAEIRVGCFLLHSYRVYVAHRRQVVIHHLEWALSGVQPPAGQKTREVE